MLKPTILLITGISGCGKSTVAKHLIKHYLHDYFFLDKDTLYVPLSGEMMHIINGDRLDRDSPEYLLYCRDHEYNSMIDCAKENALLGKNTLLCAPFGKEMTDRSQYEILKHDIESVANLKTVWIQAHVDITKQNIIKRAHAFDKYKLEHWDECQARKKVFNPSDFPETLYLENDGTTDIDLLSLRIHTFLRQKSL